MAGRSIGLYATLGAPHFMEAKGGGPRGVGNFRLQVLPSLAQGALAPLPIGPDPIIIS